MTDARVIMYPARLRVELESAIFDWVHPTRRNEGFLIRLTSRNGRNNQTQEMVWALSETVLLAKKQFTSLSLVAVNISFRSPKRQDRDMDISGISSSSGLHAVSGASTGAPPPARSQATNSQAQDYAGAEAKDDAVGGLHPSGGKGGVFAEDGRAATEGIQQAAALPHAG